MIRLGTTLRTMPATWLALPIWALAAAYVNFLYPADGYAVDASAKATTTLAFIAPFVAACAAWEGSRLGRGGVWDFPLVRSRLAVGFWAVLPAVLVGIVAITVAIVAQVARSDAGFPDPRFLVMSALDLAAYGALGLALGRLLPFAVAGPVAIVLPFLWLAFVPAMEPVWMRHLTGMFRDCCGNAQDLDLKAALASALVDAGIVGTAALLVTGGAGALRRIVAPVAPLVVSLAVAAMLVSGMKYDPAVARDPNALECSTAGGVTVCLWPEHRQRADEVAAIVGDVHEAWQAAGIAAPSVYTEADARVKPEGALAFSFNGALSKRDDIINSLGYSMAPPFRECFGGSTGAIVLEYLQAWYAAAGGMSQANLQEEYGYEQGPPYPEVLDVVADLQAATPAVRREWMSRAARLSQICEGLPVDQIAVVP
ncbi:MAG: hypothetical protein ABI622_09695 [Chloroflexota bacterium]